MAFLMAIEPNSETITLSNHFTLGTDSSCQKTIQGAGLGDRHCRIELRDNTPILKDLRSGHGTRVNGRLVNEMELIDGDEIQLGSHRFYFYTELKKNNGLGLNSKNQAWSQQLEMINHVAKTPYSVILLGPSGTGKEVLAKAIHESSARSEGPFVSVNCSALTETLVESELFGHIKGSFTGAIADRKGAFEAARGGTLFLDEIGDLPYNLQAKLLRALENNEIRPVGSDRTIRTDVRIISATHQNVQEKILRKEFRADLFFRLNVINVVTPRLRDRMEDFDSILMSFAKQFKVCFSIPAIEKLKQYSWPGNIRELKNAVTRASALFPKTRITEEHVPYIVDFFNDSAIEPNSQQRSINVVNPTASPRTSFIKEVEKEMILERLRVNFGNQRRTATELGIPKSTLHDRLREYNVNAKDFARSLTAQPISAWSMS